MNQLELQPKSLLLFAIKYLGEGLHLNYNDKILIKKIYDYIQSKYEYYDQQNKRYCGDEFTDQIFNEAALHFDKSKQEIYNLYFDFNYVDFANVNQTLSDLEKLNKTAVILQKKKG